MNIRRILLGGLVAGLLYNIGGMTIALLLDIPGAFERFGWAPSPTAGVLHMTMRFGLGVVSIFLYAGMRPRFGSGPQTAMVAAATVWFLAYVLAGVVLMELGVFTLVQTALSLIWGLMEATLATMLGAWLYREERLERGED